MNIPVYNIHTVGLLGKKCLCGVGQNLIDPGRGEIYGLKRPQAEPGGEARHSNGLSHGSQLMRYFPLS